MKKHKVIFATIVIISLLAGILPADCYALNRELGHNEKYAQAEMLRGIDVSHHQGEIDWPRVKAAGVDYAIIRVAGRYVESGILFEDEQADANMQGAQDAGIPYGVYIYSHAITEDEAREEAAYILERIAGYDIALPVVFDFEYYGGGEGRLAQANLSAQQQTDICLAFCEEVECAGYTPMVYANKNMLSKDLEAYRISDNYPVWLAHYNNSTDYQGEYTFWQYTSSGKVDGIKGSVDLNVWYRMPGSEAMKLQLSLWEGKLKLNWEAREGAVGYEIWCREHGQDYACHGTVDGTTTEYVIDRVISDKLYVCRVRAVMADGTYSTFSNVSVGCVKMTVPPKKTSAQSVADCNTFSWSRVENAEWYIVERRLEGSAHFEEIAKVKSCQYKDEKLQSGTEYCYRIRATRYVGETQLYSPYSSAFAIKTAKTTQGKVTVNGLNVRKKASYDAKVLTTLEKNTVVSILSVEGSWYKISLKIRGKKKEAYVRGDYIKVIKVNTPILAGKGTKYDRVKLSWEKVNKADGYEVWRYDTKTEKYVRLSNNVKSNKYIDKNLTAQTNYQYRIRAYRIVNKTKVYSAYSEPVVVRTKDAITGKVKASKVILRKKAGTGSKKLKYLNKGKKVQIFAKKGSWYQVAVKIKGKQFKGYIHKKYIKL